MQPFVKHAYLKWNGVLGGDLYIGLGLKGKTGGASYHLMIANGPGQRPERDNGKKLYASVQFQPGAGNQLELYGDIDMIPGDDSVTLKSFVDREAAVTDAGEDKTRMGLSAFASLPVTSDWRGFARLDAVNDRLGCCAGYTHFAESLHPASRRTRCTLTGTGHGSVQVLTKF
ncbi:MAG TPA: hypothetical protein DIC52_26815 [Candidatus Latescibacteria bacterium]|nr:hypothetical protein [Candidatus Latescibacterota bacterium]